MLKQLKKLIKDTLFRDGRWSKTFLTMFTAWISALYMAFYDLYKSGFDYQVFLTLVGVATGINITKALSERIVNGLNNNNTNANV